jgi:hypothetical protein
LNTQSTTTPPASLHPYAISSLNSLSHGGASETLFIPGENPADYYRELDEAFTTHQPSTAQDAHIVTESVHARWLLSRRHRTHNRYQATLHTEIPDPSNWSNEQLHRINLMDRYKTQAERAFRRSLSNLQSIRKEAFAQERWREHLKLAIEKTDLQRQKFEHAKEKADRVSRAEEAIDAKFRQVQEAGEKMRADNAPLQSHERYGGSVIVQRAYISLDRGATFIDEIIPSNDRVRKIIAERETYAEPPRYVVRRFSFCDGIPPEYQFLIDAGFRRPFDDNFRVEHNMSFKKWALLAEKEDAMLAIQPEAPDEPDDE